VPWEEGVFITPLPEPGKPNYLSELIQDARRFDAKVINEAGGTVNKTFFYPAIQCQRGPDAFPFTGRKDSAEGTLSVSDALRVFSIRTLVAAKESQINKKILTEIVRARKSAFLSTDFIL